MERFVLTDAYLAKTLQLIAADDAPLRAALERHGVPSQRRHPAGFATLARALTGQQLSVKAASTIYARLLRHHRGELAAEQVARTRVATLRRLGLSERKAVALRELARVAASGALPLHALPQMSDAEIVERISACPGFGVWSAQMYLIFSLGRPDVWPTGDLGVRLGLANIVSSEAREAIPRWAEQVGQRYAPYRSSLALMCWHVRNSPTLE